jgi:hypothetical protein
MSDSASEISRLTDFSDRVSPMLVKELRQGMRTNLFTIAFILLQAFMVLCVLIGAAAPGDSGAVAGFFWFFVIVALQIVMPIRGFGALNAEIQLNTMDLIHLTELGAWRITFGKWAALIAQTLLLVCGILPYLVMRYFFGGVDLAAELLTLFWVVVLSMLLTAITVGFSAFRSVLLRVTVIAGIVIGALIVQSEVSSFVRMLTSPASSGLSAPIIGWSMAGTLFAALYVMWFMLDLGASRIAPEADNHSTRKRLVALVFGCAVLLLPLAGVEATACLIIVGVIWMLVSLDALTERPVLLPSILRPFARRWYLRPWALLFAPGWHTGVFFFLLCLAIYSGAIGVAEWMGTGSTMALKDYQILVSAATAVVFPLLIIHLFFRRLMSPAEIFGIYLLIQVCSGVVAFFLMIMANESPVSKDAYLLAPIPLTTFFAAMEGHAELALIGCAGAFGIIAVLVTLYRGLPLYRDSIRMLRALRATDRRTS